MNMNGTFDKFRAIEKKAHVYGHAQGIIYFDSVTSAPSGASEGISETLGILSSELYELVTGKDTKDIVDLLFQNVGELDPEQLKELKEFNRDNEYMSSIPKDEYVEYQKLVSRSENIWENAKKNNDFSSFAPCLEKLVDFNRKFAHYYKPYEKPYNVLLDMYEPGLDIQKADAFFYELKTSIVPLLKKIGGRPDFDCGFMKQTFPIYRQRELSDILMDTMCIDRSHCGISESEHPFTTEFNKNDVRITTHYYEGAFASSMYSVIHEGGHALYELNSGDKYEYTSLSGGVSMGVHESQSRFFENIIGRSKEFCTYLLPILKEMFPGQMSGVTAEELYRAVNKAQPSLIRIEADELTYPLHIMVRYELEKALISGELKVSELPDAWNSKYNEYLGVDVPDDKHGVLQDSHWGGGMFGYFPSYALGSAYSAQIAHAMKKDIKMFELVSKGNFAPIVNWLTEKIYRYGKLYDPEELIKKCCGAPFDPQYYIEYLKEKFGSIYGIS